MEKLITLPRTTSNIGEMLCTSLAKSQANWRANVASETLTGVKMKKSGMFIGERA